MEYRWSVDYKSKNTKTSVTSIANTKKKLGLSYIALSILIQPITFSKGGLALSASDDLYSYLNPVLRNATEAKKGFMMPKPERKRWDVSEKVDTCIVISVIWNADSSLRSKGGEKFAFLKHSCMDMRLRGVCLAGHALIEESTSSLLLDR